MKGRRKKKERKKKCHVFKVDNSHEERRNMKEKVS